MRPASQSIVSYCGSKELLAITIGVCMTAFRFLRLPRPYDHSHPVKLSEPSLRLCRVPDTKLGTCKASTSIVVHLSIIEYLFAIEFLHLSRSWLFQP